MIIQLQRRFLCYLIEINIKYSDKQLLLYESIK